MSSEPAAPAPTETKECKCHICEAFVGNSYEDYPYGGEVQVCNTCLAKFGTVLSTALSSPLDGEPSDKFDAHFVAVLKSGREIHFSSATLEGEDWIFVMNVHGVYGARRLPRVGSILEGGKNYYHLCFRLSEISYIYDAYEKEEPETP